MRDKARLISVLVKSEKSWRGAAETEETAHLLAEQSIQAAVDNHLGDYEQISAAVGEKEQAKVHGAVVHQTQCVIHLVLNNNR
jgi:hypothetical protein